MINSNSTGMIRYKDIIISKEHHFFVILCYLKWTFFNNFNVYINTVLKTTYDVVD